MVTTIRTSSMNCFTKIRKYLGNKRVLFIASADNGIYTLAIYNLTDTETTSLISKMTKHFHLTKRIESMALAA